MFKNIRRKMQQSRYIRNEQGQILLFSMLIMLIGSLTIASTLSLAGSALRQGSISEDRTMHLYAADAGIESAWQKIANGDSHIPDEINTTPGEEPTSDNSTYFYTLNLADGLTTSVRINLIEKEEDQYSTYGVRSKSISASGKTTIIDARLKATTGPYGYFLDNSFTTEKNIDFKSKITVNGDVQAGTHTGKVPEWGSGFGWEEGTPTVWPTSTELINYYTNEVTLGLAIEQSGGWSPSGDVVLESTQYVDGDFDMSGSTLDLNGYTLFVNGNVNISNTKVNPPVGEPATSNSGCIVSTGDVTFWPSGDTGYPPNGVFILSLGSAGAEFLPGNDFYGWIAAQNGIQVKSGNDPSYNWVFPPVIKTDDESTIALDFPGLNSADTLPWTVQISTWEVKY